MSCSSCIGETFEEFFASMFLTFLQYLDIFQQVKCNGLSSLTIQVHWKIEKKKKHVQNCQSEGTLREIDQ